MNQKWHRYGGMAVAFVFVVAIVVIVVGIPFAVVDLTEAIRDGKLQAWADSPATNGDLLLIVVFAWLFFGRKGDR